MHLFHFSNIVLPLFLSYQLENIFGSIYHSDHSTSMACSKEHNNVHPPWISETTRVWNGMKNYCYMCPLSQVSNVIMQKPQFLNLKRHKYILFLCDFLFAMCHVFYPVMRLVWLADSKFHLCICKSCLCFGQTR